MKKAPIKVPKVYYISSFFKNGVKSGVKLFFKKIKIAVMRINTDNY